MPLIWHSFGNEFSVKSINFPMHEELFWVELLLFSSILGALDDDNASGSGAQNKIYRTYFSPLLPFLLRKILHPKFALFFCSWISVGTISQSRNINYEFFMIRMKVWTKNIEKTAILRCLLGLNVNIEHTLFFSLFFQFLPTAVTFPLRMFY